MTSDAQIADAFRHIYGQMIDDNPPAPTWAQLSTTIIWRWRAFPRVWMAAAAAAFVVVAAVGGVAWLVSGGHAPVGGTSAMSPCAPTRSVAMTQWLVRGQVVNQKHWGPSGYELTVQVSDVLWTRDYYYWIGKRYDTPEITAGSTLKMSFADPTLGRDLEGRTLIMGVQAAGTPEELAAGTGEHLEWVFSVRLVFDSDWHLIDAANGGLNVLREVLRIYGNPGQDRVVALLNDAWVGYAADEAFIASKETAPEDGTKRPVPTTAPGPLGEWRKAHGCDSVPETASPTTAPTGSAREHADRDPWVPEIPG
jgi:hypothetical protein